MSECVKHCYKYCLNNLDNSLFQDKKLIQELFDIYKNKLTSDLETLNFLNIIFINFEETLKDINKIKKLIGAITINNEKYFSNTKYNILFLPIKNLEILTNALEKLLPLYKDGHIIDAVSFFQFINFNELSNHELISVTDLIKYKIFTEYTSYSKKK